MKLLTLLQKHIRPCQGGVVLLAIFAISFFFAVPTSAATCNPTDIHQPICISVAIGDADLQLSATDRDTNGIMHGNHSVSISSNAVSGFNLSMSGDNDNSSTDLINYLPDDRSDRITSITKAGPLTSKSWGYTLSNPTSGTNASYEPIPSSSNPAKLYGQATNGIAQQLVYYGVRLNNTALSNTLSGRYVGNVIYTVTTNIAMPTITAISPDSYTVGYSNSNQITITGTNLASTYNIYIDLNNNGTNDAGEECANIEVINDTTVTCSVPTSYDHRTADLPLRLTTQGGVATTTLTYINSICRNADDESDCQVDIDPNMIPIRYAGSATKAKWVTVTDNEVENSKGAWYDYSNKQWANAITVQKDRLSTYQNSDGSITESEEVNEADILGYYVYIPRYAYEVMRRDATDKVVQPQNFNIRFETASDVKKSPKPCASNQLVKTMGDMWVNGTADNVESNIKAKDYRTGCGINRDYSANTLGQSGEDQSSKQNSDTTWATHPAFTWTYTKEANGFDQTTEFNGFWMGKFETNGAPSEPTILPNRLHFGEGSERLEGIGKYYSLAKSIGLVDNNNTIGGNMTVNQNSHNLASSKTHMVNNSEWGAAAYLSASHYGAGYGGVQLNASFIGGIDQSYYNNIAGCGPSGSGNIVDTYSDTGTMGSQSACSSSDNQRAYNGDIGQLASTTNNEYGVYDMAGGAWEVTSGNLTTQDNAITRSTWEEGPTIYHDGVDSTGGEPYVSLYRKRDGFGLSPAWSLGKTEMKYNNDVCTYELCGGQGIHEVNLVQSVDNEQHQSWGEVPSHHAVHGS